MEEISAAMAVPFVLGNLIYEESVLTTHVEIAGFELITSKTSLLTEPPSTKVSIGTGNESYECHNLDTGAPIVKVSSVKEIKKVIEDTKKVMEDGNVSVSSDTADLEGKSITDSEIPIDVVMISGNIATVDGSIFLETNTMLKNVGDLEKVVVNNESKDIESVKNMTNTVSKNVEDKEKAVVNNESKDVDSNKTVATAHSEAPREKKIKICSENVFELGCVPLWGYQSICGKSKDMEDAVVTLPRFLRIPSQMIMCGQSSNGMNQNPSHVTADFFWSL